VDPAWRIVDLMMIVLPFSYLLELGLPYFEPQAEEELDEGAGLYIGITERVLALENIYERSLEYV
jgi:hypothetical protein